MHFEFGFYSSLLLISFSQGIVYSLLLFKKAIQTQDRSNYWLSVFVFLCSLYIAPWMLGFAGWYDNQPYRDFLFYFPFQQLFFIGPVIFFYTQSLLNPSFRFGKNEMLHLIPGLLYLCYILTLWIYDKLILHDYYFYKDGSDRDFDQWYQKTGLISMVVYFALSIRYYNAYKKLMFQVVSYAESVLFRWVKTYLCAFLIMLLLPILFDIAVFFYPQLSTYKGNWWYFLCFSIVMYYIAITGYSNAAEAKISFRTSVLQSQPMLLLHTNPSGDVQEETIDIEYEVFEPSQSPDIELWKQKIDALIRDEKLYRDPQLNLTQVSKKLDTNASVISKVINLGFQKNFNDFINDYRIDDVIKSFEDGGHKKQTLLGIAYDSGFNSKATFNRAFKKSTGVSPKQFLSQQ